MEQYYFTINFNSKPAPYHGDWKGADTSKATYGKANTKYASLEEVDNAINEYFKNTEIAEAVVFKWTKEFVFNRYKIDPDYERARNKIGNALIELEDVENRRKVLQHFLDCLDDHQY
jgi:hypothetical protein